MVRSLAGRDLRLVFGEKIIPQHLRVKKKNNNNETNLVHKLSDKAVIELSSQNIVCGN